MSERERELAVVNEIAKRYGDVIDLKNKPFVMVEILRTFGRELENGTGGAPPAPPPSSIAIAGPGEEIVLEDLMKVALNIQRDILEIKARLQRGGR
jgi:hypothetical protein